MNSATLGHKTTQPTQGISVEDARDAQAPLSLRFFALRPFVWFYNDFIM
jgi:hypothetical protein